MNRQQIGEFIRRHRAYRGLTQEELASHIGVKFITVSRWETGKTEPTITQMINILEVLGCAEQFFEEVRDNLK